MTTTPPPSGGFDTSLHDMLAALTQVIMRLRRDHAKNSAVLRVIAEAGCHPCDNATELECKLLAQQYMALCDLYHLTVYTHGTGK
jgi:hypothetical protein